LQRDKLVSKFCKVIPTTLTALDDVLEEVMPVVRGMCCAPEDTDNMELALREALANAILHGNEGDPKKQVVVACFCECEEGGGVLLVVRDEGPGFDPDTVPDPTASESIYSGHGRGIYLMRQFMDEVQFRNGGREVELRKRGKPECRS
jgi:serine/threonine-protein kinase RsbW